MSKSPKRKRSVARALAFQALYQWDAHRGSSAEVSDFFDPTRGDRDVSRFAGELAAGVVEHVKEIDAAIQEAASHWRFDRIAAVDRAILRLGVYQLLEREDIPPRVAIDESINLAKRFSTEQSGAFVNGVLDHVFTQLTLETEPQSPSAPDDDE